MCYEIDLTSIAYKALAYYFLTHVLCFLTVVVTVKHNYTSSYCPNLFFLDLFILYVWVFECVHAHYMCACAVHVFSAFGRQKKLIDALELEL